MLNFTSIQRDLKPREDRNESKARYTWAAAFRALLLFVLVVGLGTLRPPLVAEGAKRDCGPAPGSDCMAYDDLLSCCLRSQGGAGCSGVGSGGAGGADVGAGLFVCVATGNVWTEVPVVEVAADGKVLGFRLRYDSRFAGDDGVGDSQFRALVRRTVLGPNAVDLSWRSFGVGLAENPA